MSRNEDGGCLAILIGLSIIAGYIQFVAVCASTKSIIFIPVFIGIAFILLVYKCYKLNKEINEVENELSQEKYHHRKTLDDKNREIAIIKKEKDAIEKKNEKLNRIIKSDNPFSLVADLYSDIKLIVYDETSNWLKIKKHPAKPSSEYVKELKIKTKSYILRFKEMNYKYNYLLQVFPELKKYVDDYEALKSLSSYGDYSDFEENIDRARNYLSEEEWNKLSVDERNQLALDNYNNSNKSKWTVGMEYEMYVDYILRENGYITIPYGIEKGLNDLGRDIIAYKGATTYIIQCKNWSVNREIHENVICQLFGTLIEYKIKHENVSLFKGFEKKYLAVLYTTTKLSDMANEFANRLGVKVVVCKMGKYPMIKCNINKNGERIYHLPFDQQYYSTKIDAKKGEMYAWTVNEAVENKFRRAFKFNYNK